MVECGYGKRVGVEGDEEEGMIGNSVPVLGFLYRGLPLMAGVSKVVPGGCFLKWIRI